MTASACYSRFTRNGPLVAKQRGEEYKKDWYVHMKGKVASNAAGADDVRQSDDAESASGMSAIEDAEVAGAVEEVQKSFWSSVAAVVNAKLGSRELTEEEVKAAYDRANANVV